MRREIAVEAEHSRDSVAPHDLEADPVDQRDYLPSRSEQRALRGAMNSLAHPEESQRRQKVIVQPPNRFWPKPPLNEGARLDGDVVVRDEHVSLSKLGQRSGCPRVMLVTGRQQREEGGGVD